MKVLMGKDIARVCTLNTMYANGHIELTDSKGEVYRMHVDNVLEMVKQYQFIVTMKRKYNHLTVCMDDGKKNSSGFFSIARLHRDDLIEKGFDGDSVNDSMMEHLASKLGDSYVENDFWESLPILADELSIKKLV